WGRRSRKRRGRQGWLPRTEQAGRQRRGFQPRGDLTTCHGRCQRVGPEVEFIDNEVRPKIIIRLTDTKRDPIDVRAAAADPDEDCRVVPGRSAVACFLEAGQSLALRIERVDLCGEGARDERLNLCPSRRDL